MAVNSTVTLSFVESVMKRQMFVIWRMWDATGDLIDQQINSGKSVDDSINLLRESFAAVCGEFVSIQVSKEHLKKGGDQISNVFKYRVLCKSPAVSPVTTATDIKTISGLSNDYLPQLIQLNVALAETRKDMRIMQLETEIDKLKKEQKEKGGKSSVLEKYILRLLDESQPANKPAPAINGPIVKEASQPVTGTEQDKKEAAKRLVDALNRLKLVDSGLVDSVEKLAKFAEQNPEQYKQYLSML